MESVEHKFNTMLEELGKPSTNHYAGDKQIYYLSFPPDQALAVKRKTETLTKLAEFKGWTVYFRILRMLALSYLTTSTGSPVRCYYNRNRKHSSLGYRSPEQFENEYYLNLSKTKH